MYGDRNTKYFQAYASERKKKNWIHTLRREDGVEVIGEEGIKDLITNYFSTLFTPVAGADANEILNHINPKVTAQMNAFLTTEFTTEEVKAALDSIGDLKAPGMDGLPAIFYKHYWQLIGDSVAIEVLQVLRGGCMPAGWNDTLVVLIPKVQNPETLKDLRPISFCNVVYKLVSKVLANRLKNILGEVISPNQSAFVPGRLISNNTILAYEMTHFMKRKRTGKCSYAALKLDMSKAYDRVEWAFLEKVMLQLGFAEGFVQLIMKCIRTVKFRFKVNGSCTDQITPGRGLRQGDPISPYLFLLCVEGLSALLQHAEDSGQIKGVKIAPTAPSVSHLLFADDSLLLMEATPKSIGVVNNILHVYEIGSGQVINWDKSTVLFSWNTTNQSK